MRGSGHREALGLRDAQSFRAKHFEGFYVHSCIPHDIIASGVEDYYQLLWLLVFIFSILLIMEATNGM